MLDDRNLSLDDLLIHVIGSIVQLHGIKSSLRSHMVGSLIQKIPFGRADLPDCPVIPAHIIFRSKTAVAVCGIGVNQRIPVIDPVHCACQRSVSLWGSCLPVCLCDRYPELFQYVMDGGIGHFVPVDGYALSRRNHIPLCCLHFLQCIGCIAGD